MRPSRLALIFAFSIFTSSLLLCDAAPTLAQSLSADYARDPAQPIDQHYTDQMRKYTTDPAFTSPLVDYLPASTTVPTPAKVLGDVSGAPDMLPYAEDVYKYFRMLEASSPAREGLHHRPLRRRPRDDRRRHRRPGTPARQAKENSARLAQLADPRTIDFDDAKARELIEPVVPRLLHHRHHPLARNRRAHRADGARLPPRRRRRALHQIHPLPHDRAHHPGRRGRRPRSHGRHLQLAQGQSRQGSGRASLYWGHYVAHDNNRDAMAHDPRPHPQRPRHLSRLARAGAARPARVRPVPLRQHRRRRPLQRLGRSHARRRMGRARLEQRRPDAELRHARSLHPRRLRYLEPRLPDVPRRHAQRHQPPLRNLRQRRRRHRKAHPRPGRILPHLVPPEPAVPHRHLVAARQQ